MIARTSGCASREGISSRIVKNFSPGSSTATSMNVDYRLNKLVQLKLLKGRWLDYGCADGGYTAALVNKGADSAVGFDVLEDRIALAQNKYLNMLNVQFLYSSAGEVPVADGYFDGVFMNEVFEHVTDEAKTLTELNRVIRAGGHLVVISPNRWFPFECHGATFGKLNLRFPVPLLPWVPSAIGQRYMHARNYWPKDLAELVRKFGFKIETVCFVWPVLEVHAWLPSVLIRFYQRRVTTVEGCRSFAGSVFLRS